MISKRNFSESQFHKSITNGLKHALGPYRAGIHRPLSPTWSTVCEFLKSEHIPGLKSRKSAILTTVRRILISFKDVLEVISCVPFLEHLSLGTISIYVS